jgi:hypothetical protein
MKNDHHTLLQFATAESVRTELFRIGNVVNVWPLLALSSWEPQVTAPRLRVGVHHAIPPTPHT